MSSTNAQFRPMSLEDLPQVLSNERLAYAFPWSEASFRDGLKSDNDCEVMLLGSKIIGHSACMLALDEYHILNLCIRPDKQGRGYGRQLLQRLLGRAEAQALNSVWLEVRRSNHAAIGLYQSEGFIEQGERRGYYPAAWGREDAIIMVLPLSLDWKAGL